MNAAVAQELWKGQIIDGKFPLLEWLGGSAHSAVFRTQLPGSATQFAAIKLIRADRSDAAQQIGAWRELVTLAHSNLLRVFHAGHCQMTGTPWLYVVTDYADENVDQVLPVRPLAVTEVSELLPPVLDLLAFLHSKGLVHSRIKPSNICAVKNQLKVSAESVHRVSQVLKPYFLTAFDAPESESGTLAPAADVWSLGMTVVAAFDQRPLTWSRTNTLDPVVPKSVPAPYGQIARECLRMNPAERCSLSRIRELMTRSAPAAEATTKPVTKTVSSKPFGKSAFSESLKLKKFLAPAVAVLVLAGIFAAIKFGRTPAHPQNTSSPAVASEPGQAQEQPAPQTPAASAQRKKPTAYGGKSAANTNPPVSTHLNSPTTANSSAVTSSPATTTEEANQINAAKQVAVVESDPSAPGIVKQFLPQVPGSARQTITGKVRVKVELTTDANGNVSAAQLAVPGPSRYFARLALGASKQWKFQPGSPSQWTLEYRFGRSGTEVTPSH